MTNKALDHQANELAKAFADTINIERTKARLDVFTIIKEGQEKGRDAHDILISILNWVSMDDK